MGQSNRARHSVVLSAILLLCPAVWAGCAADSGEGEGDSHSDEEELVLDSKIPRIDFAFRSNDRKAIALTFDDGPDGNGNTDSVLDTLKREGVRATFFINTHNVIDINASSVARHALQRIVDEGHELGSHTVHHKDLATLSSAAVDAEFAGMESEVKRLVPEAPPLTLVRAPFGSPYFGPQSTVNRVAPIVAKHGVHIGWQIDTNDWKCPKRGAACTLANFRAGMGNSGSGVVLLHSIHRTTADALPQIIKDLRGRGMHFVTVEHFVREKYGKTSAEVMGKRPAVLMTQPFCPDGTTADTTLGYCTDDKVAYGPFTHEMERACIATDGGTPCTERVPMTVKGETVNMQRWEKGFVRFLRGDGECPAGAAFDGALGYCTETTTADDGTQVTEAYGPFRADLVEKCRANGGGPECYLGRWDIAFARFLVKR